MPLNHWSTTFQTATYLINRLPTPIINYKSPFQKLFINYQITSNYVFSIACVIVGCIHTTPINYNLSLTHVSLLVTLQSIMHIDASIHKPTESSFLVMLFLLNTLSPSLHSHHLLIWFNRSLFPSGLSLILHPIIQSLVLILYHLVQPCLISTQLLLHSC